MRTLTKEYGEWIKKVHPWTRWFTLTSDNVLRLPRARRKAENIMLKLGVQNYFWVAERNYGGGYHLHALLETSMAVKEIERILDRSTRGCRNDVQEYRAGSGRVEEYLSKEIDRHDVDWEIR